MGLVINDPWFGAGLEPAASSPLCSAAIGRLEIALPLRVSFLTAAGGMRSGFGSDSEPPELHREKGQEDAQQGAGSTQGGLGATNPSQSFLSLLCSVLLRNK